MDDPLEAVTFSYVAALENLATALTGRTQRSPDGTLFAMSGAPIASLNGIVSPLLSPDVSQISSLTSLAGAQRLPWSIRVRGVPDRDVAEVAAAHGLTRYERQPLMTLSSRSGALRELTTDPLRVRALAADELVLYAETVAAGYQVPREVFHVLANPSLKLEGFSFYLAELKGVPVGTGMTASTGGQIGIFTISTLPEYRRRGYARMVTAEIVRRGFSAGADAAYLHAVSGAAESVYASIGFETQEFMTVITAP
ncbi:GNAT family N-acetyltransferase [Streptomyces liangshanensis]|uniref:GNAT family N-acetyltransferase n=1 Tax=Streptomyces liangshanensis TaxID=2717324 RepID=UPI001FBA9DDA|nr:GNAT family N-acetyltransferase [Streptomyces liangshanensis]